MAEQKALPIPKQSLVRIGIYVAGLLVVAYFFNVGAKDKVTKLSAEINTATAEIERQKVLHPFYKELEREKDKQILKELKPVEVRQPMRQDEVNSTQELIQREAASSGLAATSVLPDPASLAEDPNQLLMNCELSGPYTGLREFLKRVSAIKHVKHLQQITATEAVDGLLYTVKVRLAVASGNATAKGNATDAKSKGKPGAK